MIKNRNYLKFIFFGIVVFGLVGFASGQTAWGLSDIRYDEWSKQVTSYSGTYLDFLARLHYDPAVCGRMYQTYSQIGGACYTGYNSAWNGKLGSTVGFRTTTPAPYDTRFDVISNHYVVAYFWTDVIMVGEEEPVGRQWYDPYRMKKSDGQNPGIYAYKGSVEQALGGWYDYQYFLLGTTGRAVIANPTSCDDSAAAIPVPACEVPLKLKVTNEFKGNADLNGSSNNNALIGTPTEFRAEVSDGNGTPVGYNWLQDAVELEACRNKAICTPIIDDKTIYNFQVYATQTGSPPKVSSFTVNGILPTLVSTTVTPYPVTNGFSGTERAPRLTSGNGNCGHPSVNLVLGCPNIVAGSNAQPNEATKGVAGMYVKAVVARPADLVSKGDSALAEIFQIIKRDAKRSGKLNNGQEFTDTRSYNNYPNDFRRDFVGSDFRNTSSYTYHLNFENAESGNVTLEYVDSPAEPLASTIGQSDQVFNYTVGDQVRTYIRYRNVPIIGSGVPDVMYGLRELQWRWGAAVQRQMSQPWKLFGAYFPTNEISVQSTPITFTKGQSGIVPYRGTFQDEEIWLREIRPSSPITVTTKKNVAVWRKTNGVWHVINADGSFAGTSWGEDHDIPAPGDFDGDGRADFAVFRPDNPNTSEDECSGGCSWYIIQSSDGSFQQILFGESGDWPVVADYDGDGQTNIAVYRPSTNTWYIRDSAGGYFARSFGVAGDNPVPSDYDGDGIDDIAMWRASNATWYILKSSDESFNATQWGTTTDKPVIGDYDGDGRTDLATWQTNGDWFILLSGSSQSRIVNFGNPATDIAVPGNYDNDDRTDIATYQTGLWRILRSSDDQVQIYNWGIEGDIPVPAAYTR